MFEGCYCEQCIQEVLTAQILGSLEKVQSKDILFVDENLDEKSYDSEGSADFE